MSQDNSKTDKEWQNTLTPEQYMVCRKKATEQPFSGKYYECKDKGVYKCVCCGNELFSSDTKFNSGTGWPSFWKPLKNDNIKYETDTNYGMLRTEVMCNKCGAHLGHLFDDGPAPTNLRFCINSVSLDLDKKDD
ncbi:MAG: peptide-methionine (R)-S-oxide reductase MsrB [Nitrosopumilaceae archaeon]